MGKQLTIDYIAEWDPTNEQATWSGSTYGLYRALAATFDVHRIDVTKQLPLDLRCLQLSNRILNKTIFRRHPRYFDHGHYYLSRLDRLYAAKITNDLSVQVGDTTTGRPNHNFCYHDTIWLAVDYLKQQQPDIFAYSEFTYAGDKDIASAKQYQAQIYQAGTTILSMSHWLEQFTRQHSDFKIHYVGAGINTPILSHLKQRHDHELLFVGRDFIRKGGDVVVAAFAKARQTIPDLKLIIAGPARPPKEIEGIAGIDFLGDVDSLTVAKLMQQASVFVMPSRFEAFGIVFVEAMAAGMPIIGRDRFEMPYFVQEGSGLTLTSAADQHTEAADLSAKIITILTDPTYLQRAEARADTIAKTYSWEAVAARAAEVFN
ncbi:glycosyltransferase family 4 protein [Lacticaseibacillus sp. GG6-2]